MNMFYRNKLAELEVRLATLEKETLDLAKSVSELSELCLKMAEQFNKRIKATKGSKR